MSEVNPEHPVTEMLHDHWHKICAVLLMRLGLEAGKGEIVITAQDVIKLGDGANIITHDQHDGIHLFLVSDADVEKWVKRGQQ